MRSHRVISVYFTMIVGVLSVGGPAAGACGHTGEDGASDVSFKDVVDQRQKVNQSQRATDEERFEIERSYGAAVTRFTTCQSDRWRASDTGEQFEAIAKELVGRYERANLRLREREILIIEQETRLDQERLAIEDRRKARLSDYDEEFNVWTQSAFCFYAGPAMEFAARKKRLNEIGRSLSMVYALANDSCISSISRDETPRDVPWLTKIGTWSGELTNFATQWLSLR